MGRPLVNGDNVWEDYDLTRLPRHLKALSSLQLGHAKTHQARIHKTVGNDPNNICLFKKTTNKIGTDTILKEKKPIII